MEAILLPPEVLDSLDDVSRALQRVEEQMSVVLAKSTRGGLGETTTVECLITYFALAKALNILFCLYLRGNGLSPTDHPVRNEVERLDLYENKVQMAVDRSAGANRPASSLDVRAASRFIGHSIPDLSEEQKRQVLEVGKGRGVKRQHDPKRLVTSPRKRPSGLSLADETAAFLSEARKELMEKGAGESDRKPD